MNILKTKKTYCLTLAGIFCAAAFFAGCSQPLRTLMALDAEQKGQQAYVAKQNDKFDRLLKEVKADKLKVGVLRQDIVRLYGEPVLTKSKDGQTTVLYRRPVEFVKASKIYLDFDQHDSLMNVHLEEKNVQPAQ